MPPATTMRLSPAAIACVASITAFKPEPQTWLMVVRRHARVEPGAERGLAGRVLAEPGRDDVAHQALVDGGRLDAGAGDGFAHDQGAELRGGEALEGAQELAGRDADRGDDDGRHGELLAPHRAHSGRRVRGRRR